MRFIQKHMLISMAFQIYTNFTHLLVLPVVEFAGSAKVVPWGSDELCFLPTCHLRLWRVFGACKDQGALASAACLQISLIHIALQSDPQDPLCQHLCGCQPCKCQSSCDKEHRPVTPQRSCAVCYARLCTLCTVHRRLDSM